MEEQEELKSNALVEIEKKNTLRRIFKIKFKKFSLRVTFCIALVPDIANKEKNEISEEKKKTRSLHNWDNLSVCLQSS